MSQATDTPGLWFGHESAESARERLRQAVRALTRARRLQLLLDYAFAGLLAGLCLGTVAVAAARFAHSPYPLGWFAAGPVIGAFLVAVIVGSRRLPGPLEVAIRADLMLRLKQRLSTAWEFMSVQGEHDRGSSELIGRLAMQAVRAGLPARAAVVFPLRVNRWGWLAPLAAAALLLASIADFDGVQPRSPRAADEQVVGEGQRLGAFGREMQARARRDKLPRSQRQADRIEQLGARMQSGAIDRNQALGQLGELGDTLEQERTNALEAQSRASAAARRALRSAIAGLNPGAALERMQRGALERADANALTQHPDTLERSGIPRKEMQAALERYQAGADEALKAILEKLARLERALKEDEELSKALEQVRRSQDSLGRPRVSSAGPNSASIAIDWDDERIDRDAQHAGQARAEARMQTRSSADAARAGSQADLSTPSGRADAPLRGEADAPGRVLRPQGQPRSGPELTTQGRMLPRVNRPNVGQLPLAAAYEAQIESVLSKDQYPEHYSAFLRNYFLNLNQGAQVSAQKPAAPEAQP